MTSKNGLEWTFDTVATSYETYRPSYPDELYQTLFDYQKIDCFSHTVEVGIGGGQATLPILKTGCQLIAVEYGEHLAKRCAQKFAKYPNFSVMNKKFEDVALPKQSYDLVYSATAFHWIPEAIGYAKVYDLLKPGGTFARFANHPFRDKGNPALSAEIDRLYAEYYDAYYGYETKPLMEYREAEAIQLAQIAEKYGFTDIRHALFERTRTFTAEQYIALLGTYSDHIAMGATIRNTFFAKIVEAIKRYGGTYTVYDTIDLQLARKPLSSF